MAIIKIFLRTFQHFKLQSKCLFVLGTLKHCNRNQYVLFAGSEHYHTHKMTFPHPYWLRIFGQDMMREDVYIVDSIKNVSFEVVSCNQHNYAQTFSSVSESARTGQEMMFTLLTCLHLSLIVFTSRVEILNDPATDVRFFKLFCLLVEIWSEVWRAAYLATMFAVRESREENCFRACPLCST